MESIYYKEGIYVVIESDNHENSIFDLNSGHVFLFGRRVMITRYSRGAQLAIDGILIEEIDYFGEYRSEVKADLSLSKITSYLNAIEANGVDAFIENYKKSVEFVYVELKDLSEKTELLLSSETEKTKIAHLLNQFERIRSLLISILSILFSLRSYMSAGLENEKVISVSQSIIDLLS